METGIVKKPMHTLRGSLREVDGGNVRFAVIECLLQGSATGRSGSTAGVGPIRPSGRLITYSSHTGVKGRCGPYSRRPSSTVGWPCPTRCGLSASRKPVVRGPV